MPSEQNRQSRPTGTVPKAKTRRESVPREIVPPMRRDLQRNNIPNNLVLVDWQQPTTPAQPVRNIRSRKPHTRSPGEGICFDQVPDSAVHFDHNWLPVVRPQLRSHKRGQAQGSNNMSSLGNNLGTHSSNTAIVMPTTPNAIHPVPAVNGNGLSRNESGGNNNSRNQQEWDVGATSRVPDGAPQQSRPERLQVEDRLGQIREYIEITSNLMNTVSETGESTDEENANLLKMLNDLKDSETKLEQLLVLSFNTVSEKEKPAIFENNNSNDIIVTEIESDDNDNDSYIQQRKETLENIIDGVDGDLSDLCDAMEADQLHNEEEGNLYRTATEHMQRFSTLIDFLGRKDLLTMEEVARSDSYISGAEIATTLLSEPLSLNEIQMPEERVESGQNLNNSLNSSSLRCDELRQKMSMSQRKIQLLQNQHSELLRIQESAKKELAKLNKLKETESQPSSQRVYMLPPQQLNSNSNEFSFQPMYNQQILDNDLNPISDGDHNNLNTSNGSYPNSENYHYPNQQNPTSDVNHPLSMTNSTQNSIDVSLQNITMNYNPNSNSVDVPHSNEVNLLSNNVALEAASANEFNLSDNMSNISQRLIAVDSLMQSRAEAQRMNNGYRSEQNLYEDKLRELHSKKQQMDSLVADLHSLKNQSPNSLQQQQQQHELQQLNAPSLQELESIQQKLQIRSRQQQQQLQTLQQQQEQFASIEQQQLRGHLESESGSDVECEPEPEGHSDGEPIINNEIAQINVMKAQLARLKTMMDTMNYIEAHAAGSNSQASSHQGSVGEPASPISRPNNYAESWNGSIKVNNVQDFGRQVADRGDGMGDMSLDGMSLEAVQAMTQDLRNQAIALAAERDRIVAQGQMVSRKISVERPLSSNGQTENKPEKRTNQTSGAIQSGVQVRPQRPLVGPREQQQMLLKAELEAKKRDLEHLMRKDRDQTSAINQDTCSVSGTIKSDAGYSISGEPAWSSLQRAGENAVSTTGKVNCISMESLDIPVNQNSRSDHRDNNEINQENVGLSSDNTRSNTVNSTSAIPPPMPTLNWRKNSTDSALGRWNCESANNLQGSVTTSVEMGAGTTSQQQQQQWWQNKAMQLQNQLELTTNLCNSMLQAQSLNNPSNFTRNTSTPINQTPTLTTAYPLATNYPLTAATNIPVAHATFPHLPPVLQLGLVNNESFYQQCMNAQTQQMMLASMTQCYQLLWMQQRELANLGTAVMTLQDRMLNMNLNDAASSTLLAPTAPRALSSYPTQGQQTLSAGGTPRRSPVKMTQSQTSAPVVAPVANSNLTNSHSIPVLSQFTHNENTQMRHDVVGTNFNTPNLNNQTNFANISPGNSAQNFYHNPNVNNLNQIPFDNVSNFNNSVGVPSKPNLFQNESVCIQNNTNPNSLLNLYQNQHVLTLNSAGIQSNQTFQSPSTSHAQVPTLNNQVPPGNRANNYWDNFRSYSRQNLLSGSTKSNEGFSHSPSPLVERSHNSLRQPTLPPGQSAAPKLNTDQTNTTENQNDSNQNENLPKRSSTSLFPNPANSDGCAPDIINVNQNVLQNNSQQPNSNSDHSRISFLNAFSNNTISNLNSNQNIPDMVYSVNSPSRPLNNEVNFNISLEANFKTKLLPKSSGANKKRARISNTQSVDDSEMMRNSSRRPVDERRDLNLSSDNLQREVKSTTKLFEELRENVYTEVAAFITLNETRPHFLIQLFRDLQQVSSDPLRQRTLLTIQEVVSQYLDVLQHQNRTGESQTNESNNTEPYPNSECQNQPTAPKPTSTNVQQSDSTSQGEPSNEVHSSDPTNNEEARNSLPSASSCTSACTGIPSGDRVGTSSVAGAGCEAHACGSSVGALCNVLSVDNNNDSGIVADNVAQCSPRPRPNPLLLRFQTNSSTPNETACKSLQQSEPPLSSIRHQNMNCSSTSTFDNQDRFESLPSMQQMGQCSSISPNSSPLWYAADDSSCSSGSHKPDDTLATKPDNSSDLDTLFSPCSRGSEYRSRSLTTEDTRTQSDAAIRFMPRYDLRAAPLADNGVRLDMSAPCNEDLAEADQVCGGGLDVAQLTAQESYNVTDGWSEHMEIDCDISGNMEPQTYEGENHTPQNSQYKDEDDIPGEAMGFGICISSPSPDVARVGPGGDMASEAEASWVLNMEQGLDRVPTRLSTGANGGASAPCSPSSPDNETDK